MKPFLKDKIEVISRKKISDSRGWFLKVINGTEVNLPAMTGEVYLISAGIGECRANHYHIQANEWFTLVIGKAEMLLEDMGTKEKMIICLNSEEPVTVYVPNGIAHSFRNIGDIPYVLVTYTDVLYNPKDTVSHEIIAQ